MSLLVLINHGKLEVESNIVLWYSVSFVPATAEYKYTDKGIIVIKKLKRML